MISGPKTKLYSLYLNSVPIGLFTASLSKEQERNSEQSQRLREARESA